MKKIILVLIALMSSMSANACKDCISTHSTTGISVEECCPNNELPYWVYENNKSK